MIHNLQDATELWKLATFANGWQKGISGIFSLKELRQISYRRSQIRLLITHMHLELYQENLFLIIIHKFSNVTLLKHTFDYIITKYFVKFLFSIFQIFFISFHLPWRFCSTNFFSVHWSSKPSFVKLTFRAIYFLEQDTCRRCFWNRAMVSTRCSTECGFTSLLHVMSAFNVQYFHSKFILLYVKLL